jgi:aryl-alcohol dehydrogenase-like predicted oxidoreductase
VETRPLGATGVRVSIVGFGAGPLGDERLGDRDADALVGRALDLGITLFDTARSYGASEERLGRALGARRREVLVATKGGYGVAGVADWTPDAIGRGIDDALARMKTDVIDVFFFHSCPLDTLRRDDLLGELARAKESGKIRFAGYSGENDELAWAVHSRRFDVVECSVSPLDRGSLAALVPDAAARGIGVLAKRSLANGVFDHRSRPERHDLGIYWDRLRALGRDPSPLAWPEAMIRFAAHAPGVSSALVGTTRADHLASAAVAAARGPLPAALAAELADAWTMHISGRDGVI